VNAGRTTIDREPARESGPVVLVTAAGAASGARGAAAALACVASEPDRAALLIDLEEGRAPRPTLFATAGARKLEERLVVHLPQATVASRGCICQLKLPTGPEAIEQIAAALPLARESAAVVHLPPSSLQQLLTEPRLGPTAVLLRADLARDRALVALAVRDLIARELRVAVLKRPLGWLAAHAALFGALPSGVEVWPSRLCQRLLIAAPVRD
jgi:hypothetical protein